MARKRRSAAPFTEPPRVPRGYTGPGSPSSAPTGRETSMPSATAVVTGDLVTQYAHVKKDLVRIGILGALMFVLIYLSTLFLL